MTDEKLNIIKGRLKNAIEVQTELQDEFYIGMELYVEDVSALIAEINRLTARCEALERALKKHAKCCVCVHGATIELVKNKPDAVIDEPCYSCCSSPNPSDHWKFKHWQFDETLLAVTEEPNHGKV